ncbi:hypothetical protein ON010_g11227 [Phytophthora cinnamomi]|nr:hypothetical protein ON010_g11227 [Phytophthora cinnamomi]
MGLVGGGKQYFFKRKPEVQGRPQFSVAPNFAVNPPATRIHLAMARRLLLLFASDVVNVVIEGPRYAEVMASRGGRTQVAILPQSNDEQPVPTSMSPSTARSRAFPMSELQDGMPGLRLFLPAYVQIDDNFHHGQITAYTDSKYTIRTKAESIHSDALEAIHTRILDRFLGQNNRRATKSIPRLIGGVATRQSIPQPSSLVPWKCPRTGENKLVSIGNVINYAFYTDGNRPVPSNIQVGKSFVDGPATRPERMARMSRIWRRTSTSQRYVTVELAHSDRPARSRSNRSATESQDAPTAESPTLLEDSSEEEDNNTTTMDSTRFTDLLTALSEDQPTIKCRRLTETPSAPTPINTSVPDVPA